MQRVAGLVLGEPPVDGNEQKRLEIPSTDFFLQHQNFSSLKKSSEKPYLVEKK